MIIYAMTEMTPIGDAVGAIAGLAMMYMGWRIFSVLSCKKIYNILTIGGKLVHPTFQKIEDTMSHK